MISKKAHEVLSFISMSAINLQNHQDRRRIKRNRRGKGQALGSGEKKNSAKRIEKAKKERKVLE